MFNSHRILDFCLACSCLKKKYQSILEYVKLLGRLEFFIFLEGCLRIDQSFFSDIVMTNAVQKNHIHIMQHYLNKTSKTYSIPIYNIQSLQSLHILMNQNIIDFRTLFRVRCKKKFLLFRELCKKMPSVFWNDYVEEIQQTALIFHKKNQFQNFSYY